MCEKTKVLIIWICIQAQFDPFKANEQLKSMSYPSEYIRDKVREINWAMDGRVYSEWASFKRFLTTLTRIQFESMHKNNKNDIFWQFIVLKITCWGFIK